MTYRYVLLRHNMKRRMQIIDYYAIRRRAGSTKKLVVCIKISKDLTGTNRLWRFGFGGTMNGGDVFPVEYEFSMFKHVL